MKFDKQIATRSCTFVVIPRARWSPRQGGFVGSTLGIGAWCSASSPMAAKTARYVGILDDVVKGTATMTLPCARACAANAMLAKVFPSVVRRKETGGVSSSAARFEDLTADEVDHSIRRSSEARQKGVKRALRTSCRPKRGRSFDRCGSISLREINVD